MKRIEREEKIPTNGHRNKRC